MFEIRTMVEDNKVAKLLWALDGLIVGEPQIRPVRGATAVGDRVVSTQPVPGGGLTEQVLAQLKVLEGETITKTDIADLVVGAGGAPASTNGVVTKLRDMSVLTDVGKGLYRVWGTVKRIPASDLRALNGSSEGNKPYFPTKLPDRVRDELVKRKLAQVNADTLKAIIAEVGGAPTGVYYVVKILRKQGVLLNPVTSADGKAHTYSTHLGDA